MGKRLGAFKIGVDGKILDYRLGKNLNLDDVKNFFSKKYKVKKLWQGARHVLGELEKSNQKLFLNFQQPKASVQLQKMNTIGMKNLTAKSKGQAQTIGYLKITTAEFIIIIYFF